LGNKLFQRRVTETNQTRTHKLPSFPVLIRDFLSELAGDCQGLPGFAADSGEVSPAPAPLYRLSPLPAAAERGAAGFWGFPRIRLSPGFGVPWASLGSLRDFAAAPHPPAWCMPFAVGVCAACLALNPPTRSALSQRGPPTGFPPCDSVRFGLEPFRPYQDTGRWSGVLRFYGASPKSRV